MEVPARRLIEKIIIPNKMLIVPYKTATDRSRCLCQLCPLFVCKLFGHFYLITELIILKKFQN